jgi:ribose transport system substrate-binding protein
MSRSSWFRRVGSAATILTLFVLAGCGSAPGAYELPEGANLGSTAPVSLEELYAGKSTRPPDTSPPPATGKTIWFVTCASASASCRIPAESGREAAERMGMNASIIDGKYNEGGAWSTTITNAIAAQVDGLVLVGMDCQNIQQPVRQARDAGLEILGVETSDCDPELFTVDMMFSEEIPSNDAWDYNIGVNSANYIIAKTQGRANLLISEPTSEKAPILVHRGFVDTLEANCPECRILNAVEYQTVDFVPNGAWIQAFRSQLTKFGPLADAIYMEWDIMAAELSGAQAVRDAGLDDAITFGGLGLPAAIELIRAGLLDAAPAGISQEWVGYASVDQMNRAFHGQPSVPQGIGFTLIDRDHNLPAVGEAYQPPVDWKSAYLRAWGLLV